MQVHVDLRLDFLQSSAKFVHDYFGASLGGGTNFHEEVAGVGCSQFQTEGHTSSTRETFDVRRILQHLFDFIERPIGFGQARAWRADDVIEHEAALFELGQQIRFKPAIDIDASQDQQSAEDHSDKAMS